MPCGYLLIEGESLTSAIYMSESIPIPKDKSDIAAATALAGEQLGLQFIYLDKGSGSKFTVQNKMINSVKKSIKIPLIVGGGINNQKDLNDVWKSGADIAVIGTAIEEDFKNILLFDKKLKQSDFLKKIQSFNWFFIVILISVKGQQFSRNEYIVKFAPLAVKQMQIHKIPASITLAQGILESNNGNSRLAIKGNNHFGIKCHGWEGKKIYADDDQKHECFRSYKNVIESYRDHSLF